MRFKSCRVGARSYADAINLKSKLAAKDTAARYPVRVAKKAGELRKGLNEEQHILVEAVRCAKQPATKVGNAGNVVHDAQNQWKIPWKKALKAIYKDWISWSSVAEDETRACVLRCVAGSGESGNKNCESMSTAEAHTSRMHLLVNLSIAQTENVKLVIVEKDLAKLDMQSKSSRNVGFSDEDERLGELEYWKFVQT